MPGEASTRRYPPWTVREFMAFLSVAGGWLTLKGDRVRLHGLPKFLVADSMREFINEHRPEVIAYLREPRRGLTREELDAYGRVLPREVMAGLREKRWAVLHDPQAVLDFVMCEWRGALEASFPGEREDRPW